MPQEDRNPYVAQRLTVVLQACGRAGDKLAKPRGDLVPELFDLLSAADDLVELGLPTPSSGEVHGLPKSATGPFRRVLYTHADNPQWDFAAWYVEKTTHLKQCIKRAITAWRAMTGTELRGAHDTVDGAAADLARHLDDAQSYAERILDEVASNRLRITAISADH
jgi:hypothetical protein